MKTSKKSTIQAIFAAAALFLSGGAHANANDDATQKKPSQTAPAPTADDPDEPDVLKLLFSDDEAVPEKDDGTRVVRLDDEVTDKLVDKLITKLRKLDKTSHEPIEMRINSPGGDVSAGLRLYDVMRDIRSPIHTVCEGECASMASVILAAGDTRSAMPSSIVMVHELSGGVGTGKFSDLKGRMKLLDIYENMLVDILAHNSGIPKEHLVDTVRADTFYTAEEAKALGFVEDVLYPAPKPGVKPHHAPPALKVVPGKGH